jgi:hypothetical protein
MDLVHALHLLSPTGRVGHEPSTMYHLYPISKNNHKPLTIRGNPLVSLAMYTLHTKHIESHLLFQIMLIFGDDHLVKASGNRSEINSHCCHVRLLRYALVIRSQGAGFYKFQHTPCELSYNSPPLLKHPLRL